MPTHFTDARDTALASALQGAYPFSLVVYGQANVPPEAPTPPGLTPGEGIAKVHRPTWLDAEE